MAGMNCTDLQWPRKHVLQSAIHISGACELLQGRQECQLTQISHFQKFSASLTPPFPETVIFGDKW